MKLRNFFEMLGFRAKAKTYGYRVEDFDLGAFGKISFAQWLHPKYRPTRFDPAHIEMLRRYLEPGDAVLDIGAHGGDTSVMFAVAVGHEGKVFAVEPNTYVLPVLEKNAVLNEAAAPIAVMPYAAVETPGPLTFDYSDSGFCNGGDLGAVSKTTHGHFYRLEVDGRNIADELAKDAPEWMPRIRLIKSDTEGNDAAVIDSLKPFIKAHKPMLICEIYRHMSEQQRRDFYATLHDELGYRVFLAEPFDALEIDELGPDDLMKHEHYDIFCKPA